MDFLLYNPRSNTVSSVAVNMVWNAAGALSSKKISLHTILLNKEAKDLETLELIFLIWTIFDSLFWLMDVRTLFRRHSFQQFLSKTLYSYWTVFEVVSLTLGPIALMEHKIYQGVVDEIKEKINDANGLNVANGLNASNASTVLESDSFLSSSKVQEAIDALAFFDRVAAFALLFVFLRIIAKLKESVEKVALLE